jgi:hypothetical protein
MLDRVMGISSAGQVPIAYAVDRLVDAARSANLYNSRAWHQRNLIYSPSKELEISKVRNRYACSKARVDAMDFKLWQDHPGLQ